jgi:hypothetical protein
MTLTADRKVLSRKTLEITGYTSLGNEFEK